MLAEAVKSSEASARVEGPYSIGLQRREKLAWVYEVKNEKGEIEQIALPIYGKGLWSTLLRIRRRRQGPPHDQWPNLLRTRRNSRLGRRSREPRRGNPSGLENRFGKKVRNCTDDNLRVGVAKGSPDGERANTW